MVGDLWVSPIVPARKTLCPASPSLQWVAWAPLPHLAGQPFCTDLRYYDPLRLPDVHLGFVRSSLSAPDTLYRPSFRFVPCAYFDAQLADRQDFPRQRRDFAFAGSPDTMPLRKETSGPPEFPSYPRECMPWSKTPVVPCILALSHTGLLPSVPLNAVGFPPWLLRRLSQ
jgi:hypothetical protein